LGAVIGVDSFMFEIEGVGAEAGGAAGAVVGALRGADEGGLSSASVAFARGVALAGAAAAKLGLLDVTDCVPVTLTAVVLMPALQASQSEAGIMSQESLLS